MRSLSYAFGLALLTSPTSHAFPDRLSLTIDDCGVQLSRVATPAHALSLVPLNAGSVAFGGGRAAPERRPRS